MSTTRPARSYAASDWTDAENKVLKRLYPTADRAQVEAALPNRTWNAIALQGQGLSIKRHRYWNKKRLKVLHDHYPTQGATYVGKLLGCAWEKVSKQASLQGLVRVRAPKPVPTPKPPKVVPPKVVTPKPAPKPKPLPKPVPAPVAQHQPARLNNLINQKAKKKKKEAGPERTVALAYIKTLPYEHPEAHQYRMGGERAVLRYREQLQQQAA